MKGHFHRNSSRKVQSTAAPPSPSDLENGQIESGWVEERLLGGLTVVRLNYGPFCADVTYLGTSMGEFSSGFRCTSSLTTARDSTTVRKIRVCPRRRRRVISQPMWLTNTVYTNSFIMWSSNSNYPPPPRTLLPRHPHHRLDLAPRVP